MQTTRRASKASYPRSTSPAADDLVQYCHILRLSMIPTTLHSCLQRAAHSITCCHESPWTPMCCRNSKYVTPSAPLRSASFRMQRPTISHVSPDVVLGPCSQRLSSRSYCSSPDLPHVPIHMRSSAPILVAQPLRASHLCWCIRGGDPLLG